MYFQNGLEHFEKICSQWQFAVASVRRQNHIIFQNALISEGYLQILQYHAGASAGRVVGFNAGSLIFVPWEPLTFVEALACTRFFTGFGL